MANQFLPAEFLKLKDGKDLVLRPTNCARFGLEAYCNSIQEFSHGMISGTHEKVNFNPETVNGRNQNWFTCQMDIKDGRNSDVVRTTRTLGKSPNWLGQAGIFRGSCQYYTQRPDDMRRHFLSQHPGISQDFVIKCPVCLFSGRTVALVRKHMDACQRIAKWAADGCDPSELCPNYVLNMSHWSSQKISGDTHYQKSVAGDAIELLNRVREVTGGLAAKDVNLATIVNNDTATIQNVSIQDVSINMLLESETESLDDAEFGPHPVNDIHTEGNGDDFDVKQPQSVLRMFDDKNYRENRSDAGKNEVIRVLCQEVLEKRTLLDIGHKLNIIRKKFEGYSLDAQFLWKIQGAFDNKLGGHIVKNERNDPFESLESFFPIDSLDAEHVKIVHGLLSDYEKSYVALSRDQIIDLTGDGLLEEQRILKLKQATAEANEKLQIKLAELVLSQGEFDEYKKESRIEMNNMDQKLSQSIKAIKDLKKENEELKEAKEMADSAQMDMQKLIEDGKKNKKLVPIDIFASLPHSKWADVKFDKKDGKTGAYGCHNAAEDNLRKEQLKQKREQSQKRKIDSSFAAEHQHHDKNRKMMKFTPAEFSIPKSRNKKCGMECENIREENYRLSTENSRLSDDAGYIMVASALSYRQYLCAQAFCNYSLQYLYENDFRSKRKMYKFLYCILPRFVSAFQKCAKGMELVKPILEIQEVEAWKYFGGVPTAQNLAYFYCEEMLMRRTKNAQGVISHSTTAECLNLCTGCDEEVASHPPNACKWVKAELSKEFQELREQFNDNWLETKESYVLDNSQHLIGIQGIKLQNVNTYK